MALFGSRLVTVCYGIFFIGYRLDSYILGGYARGLVAFGTIVLKDST